VHLPKTEQNWYLYGAVNDKFSAETMSSFALLGFFVFAATVSAIPSQGSNSTRADGGSGYNVNIVASAHVHTPVETYNSLEHSTGTSSDGWSLTSQLQGQTFLDFFDLYDSRRLPFTENN
jgi:hypothetical protein